MFFFSSLSFSKPILLPPTPTPNPAPPPLLLFGLDTSPKVSLKPVLALEFCETKLLFRAQAYVIDWKEI